MFEVCRRPMGRLFFLLLAVAVLLHAQAPPTTTVSDVVYRADGTPARGTLLISWPAFIASGGQTVAAGTKSVTLGLQGALSVALVPNTGATPTTTIYTVVYQLDDGTVKTEYWLVGRPRRLRRCEPCWARGQWRRWPHGSMWTRRWRRRFTRRGRSRLRG